MEVIHRDVSPKVSAQVEQDDVDASDAIKQGGKTI